MKTLVAFACGLLFALGLGISGMLRPEKVLGFLDFFGAWDPTLLGVMCGAIPVYLVAWFWQRGRPSLWGSVIPAKANHSLDGRLILGATLFGVGWGLAGACPGPGLVAAATGNTSALAFVGAMLLGMWIFQRTSRS